MAQVSLDMQQMIRPASVAPDVQMIAVEYPAATTVAPIAVVPAPAKRPRTGILGSRLVIALLSAIFLVLAIASLQYASSLLVPIAVSLFLTLLLGPLVRWMARHGVAEPAGAAIIVFGTVLCLGVGVAALATPAAEWLRRSPQALHRVEERLSNIEPVTTIRATVSSLGRLGAGGNADADAPRVQVTSESPLHRVGWTTAHIVGGILTTVFLSYFLLASGSMFRRKIAYLVPAGKQRGRIKRALFEIETQMSRYLLINTLISIGFGLATGALLALIGMPNPILWGTIAGISNFIPYLGAIVTVIMIGIVALATSDGTQQLFLGCGGFLMLDLIKGHLVCPLVLGRRMPLNTVAILLALLFWGWVWGIVGVIMAVPITVMLQVICSHSDHLRGVAILLGNWGSRAM